MSDLLAESTVRDSTSENSRLPLLGLLFLRFATMVALPFEALVSYGDYRHFYSLARMASEGRGLPFIGHWVEFPPLFPFLSLAIERATAGSFHGYVYLLSLVMLLFDLGSLVIFSRIAQRCFAPRKAIRLAWTFAIFLAVPAFGWWTFDPMAVFFMLFSLWLILERKPALAGLLAGLGFLTKVFPLLCLAAIWRFRPRKEAITATAVAFLLCIAVLGTLLAVSPTMASASLRSQFAKGSWETVWALLDGNLKTGTFGPLEERLDPSAALQSDAYPARVPLWISTLVAGLIALWLMVKTRAGEDATIFPFIAALLCLLLLWSRGWSPQWVVYLIPLLLLSFSMRRSLMVGLILITISLLEWPILLSRGRFDLLWLPVVVRSLLLVMISIEAGRLALRGADPV
jgi:hypothetical protein